MEKGREGDTMIAKLTTTSASGCSTASSTLVYTSKAKDAGRELSAEVWVLMLRT